MPDFSALYQRPAGQAKRPPVLPKDDYKGIITGAHSEGEIGDNKTPYLQWPVRLTEWGPSVPDSWEVYDSAESKMVTIEKADVDLSKRQLQARFFTTDDALVMLDEFLRSGGFEMDGTQTYAEVLPQVVGKTVTVSVGQFTNKQTLEVRNVVDRCVITD